MEPALINQMQAVDGKLKIYFEWPILFGYNCEAVPGSMPAFCYLAKSFVTPLYCSATDPALQDTKPENNV